MVTRFMACKGQGDTLAAPELHALADLHRNFREQAGSAMDGGGPSRRTRGL